MVSESVWAQGQSCVEKVCVGKRMGELLVAATLKVSYAMLFKQPTHSISNPLPWHVHTFPFSSSGDAADKWPRLYPQLLIVSNSTSP